jgi:hypothetical protein
MKIYSPTLTMWSKAPGAAALAAALKEKSSLAGKRIGLQQGGNVDPKLLPSIAILNHL